MIKLGNTDINNIKLGETQVQKMYLGNNLVWQKYTPFATPILDLDFQNNFIDKSPSALTMVQGQGLPTFGLSGRKAGEYCANFNGSQSIKTTTNLPLNSDKVCIKFWMKTSQSATLIISELSTDYTLSNAFAVLLRPNVKIDISDRSGLNTNRATTSSLTNEWKHIIISVDRTLGIYQSKIYVNGVNDVVLDPSFRSDNNGDWINNILFIGQRGGNSLGYIGSLMKYQAFRAVPTDEQAMEMYQNDL